MSRSVIGFMCLVLFTSLLTIPAVAQSGMVENTPVVAAASARQALAKAGSDVQLGQWSTLASLPVQKCYHGVAHIGGTLYVFGGLGPDQGVLRYDVKSYKYDIAANTWSQIASVPASRALPVVQPVNGKVYVIGGYSSTNPFKSETTVYEYDPSANTYTTKKPMPFACFGAASFVYNGRIYVLGGGTTAFATSTNSIQIYDPALDAWTFSSTTTPYAFWAGTAVPYGNGSVLLVGGVRYVSGAGTFGPWVYTGSISANGDDITWTQGNDYPGGSIMRHMAGTDGTKIYLCGGYDSGSMNNGPPTGKVYAFDPANSTWTPQDMKPVPVYFGGQFVDDGNGNLYVVGGQPTYSTATQIMEKFSTASSASPKLTVSKTSFDLWAQKGVTVQHTFTVNSIGGMAATWSASANQPWITFPKQSGSIDPSKSEVVAFNIEGAQLNNGSNAALITLTTNDPDQPTITISVTLMVQDQAVDTEQNVLLEEGTGLWCGYCPYGSDSVKALVQRYPHRLQAISYHGGSAITATTEALYHPATTVWATQVSLQGWPNGSVNRIQFPGNPYIAMSRGDWGPRALEVMNTRRSPVSINVNNVTYDRSTGRIDVSVEVFFHRDLQMPLRLNLAQLQSGMNYSQVFYPPGGGTTKLYPYYNDHVLRAMLPDAFGEVLGTGEKITSQTSMTKTFSFTSAVQQDSIHLSNLIFFVHQSNGSTYGEVLQSEEFDMAAITAADDVPGAISFALSQNFPNPFNPATTITYAVPERSNVTLTVTDPLGRTVATLVNASVEAGMHTVLFDGASLPSGNYQVTMRSGSFAQTRLMTLMK